MDTVRRLFLWIMLASLLQRTVVDAMWVLKMMCVNMVMLIMIPGAWSTGWEVTFPASSLCALRGSSVVFGCSYRHPSDFTVIKTYWLREENKWNPVDLSDVYRYKGRVTYTGDKNADCSLRIDNLQERDASSYFFRFQAENKSNKKRINGMTSLDGISLSLPGLTARVPSDVREGDNVSLTCETSCQLPHPPAIVWFRDGQPVANPEFQARLEHAGWYRCAIGGQETITSDPVALNIQYGPRNITLSVVPSEGVVKGDNITFTCDSDANPPVQDMNYRLLKREGESYHEIGRRNHKILSVKPTDRGQYYCKATNGINTGESGPVTLNVQYPPENTSISVDPEEAVRGEKVTLTCSSDANPPVHNYTWYRDSGSSPISTGRQLVKENVSPEDSGHYTCRVENERGSQNSSQHHLDVLYGPRNITLSVIPSEGVVKGDNITFTCDSDANPPVQDMNYHLLKREGQRYHEIGRRNHKILSVKPTDRGQYYCKATNGINTGESGPVTLNVQYPPENTSISVDPEEAVRGEKVTLTCSSDANPPVHNYTWYRDSGSSPVSTGRQLVKENVSPEDSGHYTCRVENERGSQNSSQHHLDVLYPPVRVSVEASPPGSLAEGSSVNLTCSSEANPAADAYTWYRRTGPPGSSSLVLVGSGQLLSLDRLEPSQTGAHYFCQAKNSLGGKNSTDLSLDRQKNNHRITYVAVSAGVTVLVVLTVSLAIFVIWRKHRTPVEKETKGTVYAHVAGPSGRGFNLSANQEDHLYANTHHPSSSPPPLPPSEDISLYATVQKPSPQTGSGHPEQAPSTQEEEEVVYTTVTIKHRESRPPHHINHSTPLQDKHIQSSEPREGEDSVIYATVANT